MDTARLIYADSESSADLYYATRFFAPDPFLYLQEPTGKSHLAVSVLEVDRARRTARVDQVHEWGEIKQRWQAQSPQASSSIETLTAFLMAELRIERVLTPSDFPLLMADRLRASGVELIPEPGAFWPQRAIKNDDEIAFIREALDVTALGMAAGIEMIRNATIGENNLLIHEDHPLTSERVRGEIHAALVRAGASPRHTIVSGGGQGADPHEEGHGPLFAHQPIILDIFPRMAVSGYWGDMTRTVCKGTPPERLLATWKAVEAAQEVAFGLIRDQASGAAIHQAVTDAMSRLGFLTGTDGAGRQIGFFHGTGHGLGLEIHESPRIGGKDQTLLTGHVVTVEPGLYYPGFGGVRLEDVVVVEPHGCRNLTRFPKFLEV
ncbi:MAG: aminopeptidase P family protein [Magnetococcales bacterium]|nr:aminopeptidase P family protein [Magnetococcales bacterium]